MSAFGASAFLHDIAVDPAIRELAHVAPRQALSRYDLTAEETAMFLAGEVGQLYRGGANDFLLHNLQRFGLFGLDMATYSRRMRAEREPGPSTHASTTSRTDTAEEQRN